MNLYRLSLNKQAFQLDNPLSFAKSLLKVDQVIFESYTSHKVFGAIITLDADDNPVRFSSTFCIE